MSDQFFDDEDDLAREQEQAARQSAKPAAAQGSGKKPTPDLDEMKAAAARHGCKPPTFGMAVGIAVVALLLGICIGYFFAMNVVSRTGSVAVDGTSTMGTTSQTTSTESSSTVSDSTADSDSSDTTSSELPEGHPDLSQFYNADGTLNEEAIAEWKAARASETSSSDDASSTDDTQDAADDAQATQASSDSPTETSSDADTKSATK